MLRVWAVPAPSGRTNLTCRGQRVPADAQGIRYGGWAPSLTEITGGAGGAPLLALFEKGPSERSTPFDSALRGRKVLPMSGSWRLTLHHHAQNAVNARLVTLAMTLEPIEHVRIEANGQLLFRRRPSGRCLPEKCLVEPRNVRIVDIGVLHAVNARQVAFDGSFVHVGSPSSWR